jgi:branched-chain amino acid aminotransferase
VPSVVSLDGAIVPRDRAVVSVYDRGFLYGDTVFETLRSYGGEPHLLGAHLARLARSAELLGIAPPVTSGAMEREVRTALAASLEPEAVVRVTLSRGEGPLGLDPSAAGPARRVIFVEPLGRGIAAAQRRGVGVRLVATRRAADVVPAAQVGTYVDAVVALRAARAAGDDDALIVDPAGQIVEATGANVFAVLGPVGAVPGAPVLVTPPEGALLPGITRARVLAHARARGIMVREATLSAGALRAAREAFLTSSVREIVPLVRLDGAPVGDGAPGPITRALQAAYRADIPA